MREQFMQLTYWIMKGILFGYTTSSHNVLKFNKLVTQMLSTLSSHGLIDVQHGYIRVSKDLPKLFNRFDGEGQHPVDLDINMLPNQTSLDLLCYRSVSFLIYSMVLLMARPHLTCFWYVSLRNAKAFGRHVLSVPLWGLPSTDSRHKRRIPFCNRPFFYLSIPFVSLWRSIFLVPLITQD